jgi:hypothetical protein
MLHFESVYRTYRFRAGYAVQGNGRLPMRSPIEAASGGVKFESMLARAHLLDAHKNRVCQSRLGKLVSRIAHGSSSTVEFSRTGLWQFTGIRTLERICAHLRPEQSLRDNHGGRHDIHECDERGQCPVA